MSEEENNSSELREPTFLDVVGSVLWAFIGVQKSKNHERDFKHGKPWQYILVGLMGVAIFITIIIFAVKFALSLSGV
ncbi:MAG: DUF2970 domain-containing protein [Woeseiaceae bacterium]